MPIPDDRRLEAFCQARVRAWLGYRSGSSPALELASLYRDFGDLASPKRFLALDSKDPRRTLLAVCTEEARASEVIESLTRARADASLPFGSEKVSPQMAAAAIEREPSYDKRAAIAQALNADQDREWEGTFRLVQVAADTAGELGFSSYLALWSELSGHSLDEAAAVARELLRTTEDAYRDVLDYALKKLPAVARPPKGRGPAWHDLSFAAFAPFLGEIFREPQASRRAEELIAEGGLHARANGTIQIDREERPGRSTEPFVAPVRIPQEVMVVSGPPSGLKAFAAWLWAYGEAVALASLPADLGLIPRRLAEPPATGCFGALLAHHLLEPLWIKKAFGTSLGPARDVARLACWVELIRLRTACAELSFQVHLHHRGARDAAEAYREGMRQCLWVDPPPRWTSLSLGFSAVQLLESFALEASLRPWLRERYNEDFWRNPACGELLSTCFASYRIEGPSKAQQTLGIAPGKIDQAADGLIQSLSA